MRSHILSVDGQQQFVLCVDGGVVYLFDLDTKTHVKLEWDTWCAIRDFVDGDKTPPTQPVEVQPNVPQDVRDAIARMSRVAAYLAAHGRYTSNRIPFSTIPTLLDNWLDSLPKDGDA